MFNYIWPIGLVVLSNIIYHICAKCSPENLNPFASLTVTYGVAALASLALFFILGKGDNLIAEYKKMNWTPFVLGIVIIGLEAGFLYAYKAGWQVSMATIVQSSILSVALLFVGWLLFKEGMTWNKIVGMVVCLIGLVLINWNFK